jgi:histone deacetylase 11
LENIPAKAKIMKNNSQIAIVLVVLLSVVNSLSQSKLPIIYSPQYNISLFGIQKLHPFDTKKYKKVYKYIKTNCGIDENRFYCPEKVSESDIRLVHTGSYLESLKKSEVIARIGQMPPLKFVPNRLLQKRVLVPMKYGTGGTILGAELALQYGWAINLSGGYHHAKADAGSGFSYFADIPIAAMKLWQKDSTLKIMIIDLDAHQGNGYESIFMDDKRVVVMDVYNCQIYPRDGPARIHIKYDFPILQQTADAEYLNLLTDTISVILSKEQPGLIIYNAGTDIFQKDPLGRLSVSEAGIIQRDQLVFREALDRHVPVMMLLSGGYSRQSAGIIGRSIENILKNVIKVPGLKTRPNGKI